MVGIIWERYGSYPKKKGKKKTRTKGERPLNRSYQWPKWRFDKINGINIFHPCLEN